MDGWKTILSPWGPAYFQGRTVSCRVEYYQEGMLVSGRCENKKYVKPLYTQLKCSQQNSCSSHYHYFFKDLRKKYPTIVTATWHRGHSMPRSNAQPHRRRELRNSPVGKNGMKTKIPWKKLKFWYIFSVWFILLGKNPMETEWIPMILRWFCRILWFHDDTGQCYPELKASSPVQIYHVHFHQRSLLESYPTKGNFPKTSPNQQTKVHLPHPKA